MPIFHGPMSLDVFQPRCLWKIRWPRNWSKALRRRGGSAAQTVRRTWSQKKPWEKPHQKYNIYIWEFYGKYLWTNSICFFWGKLTLRPCQIGFGRLVSTKSRWFSGSMLIYWRVIYIYRNNVEFYGKNVGYIYQFICKCGDFWHISGS